MVVGLIECFELVVEYCFGCFVEVFGSVGVGVDEGDFLKGYLVDIKFIFSGFKVDMVDYVIGFCKC